MLINALFTTVLQDPIFSRDDAIQKRKSEKQTDRPSDRGQDGVEIKEYVLFQTLFLDLPVVEIGFGSSRSVPGAVRRTALHVEGWVPRKNS